MAQPSAGQTRPARHPFFAEVRATECNSGREVWGRTTDLSKGGCYLRSRQTFSHGAVLLIEIRHRGAVFLTEARLAYTIPADGMGLSFLNVPASQLPVLEGWLSVEAGKQTTEVHAEATE